MSVQNESILSCPKCGKQETLTIPTDACQFFHQCSGGQEVLRPLAGDCCVFCSDDSPTASYE